MNPTNFILIIEDTKSHADLVVKILNHHGYHIQWLQTGLLAIEYAKKHQPALFLIDIGLPDMSGIEVMRKLREICAIHVPMIAVTAHSMENTKSELLSCGFDDYLSKPFKVDKLIDIVKLHIYK